MAVDSFRDATSLVSSLAATGRRRDVSPYYAAPNALIALCSPTGASGRPWLCRTRIGAWRPKATWGGWFRDDWVAVNL